MMPITTVESTCGMKKKVRKSVNPFGRRQRRIASNMPMAIGVIVPTMTQMTVCCRESQKSLSPINSR